MYLCYNSHLSGKFNELRELFHCLYNKHLCLYEKKLVSHPLLKANLMLWGRLLARPDNVNVKETQTTGLSRAGFQGCPYRPMCSYLVRFTGQSGLDRLVPVAPWGTEAIPRPSISFGGISSSFYWQEIKVNMSLRFRNCYFQDFTLKLAIPCSSSAYPLTIYHVLPAKDLFSHLNF